MSENLDFYQRKIAYSGVTAARTLIQANGSIGGHRSVFVEIGGSGKNDLVYVPFGGAVQNPFKGYAKMFASDLCQYEIDGKIYILKTYLVQAPVLVDGTVVYIVRDGYKHIPFVGDVLMKAPETLTGEGVAATVLSVEETTNGSANVWKLTLSAAVGVLGANDVLVEGLAAGTTTAVVTNPNTVLPCDFDFLYDPATGSGDFLGARYMLTPVLSSIAWTAKMSPLPPSILALNKSRITGWFKI